MKQSEGSDFDPLAPWQQLQQASLQAWSRAMSDYVNSEEFAQSMGKLMEEYLVSSAPLQQQMERAMETYLQQMNMPSRSEVISLAERLTHLEMRIDDIDARLDELLEGVTAIRQQLNHTAQPPTQNDD